MDNKQLYQKKMNAKLDEWKAEVDKLKAKASGASADVQLDLNKLIKELEGKVDEGKAKLAEIAQAGEDSWDAIKESTESTWNSLKSAFSDTVSKLKD